MLNGKKSKYILISALMIAITLIVLTSNKTAGTKQVDSSMNESVETVTPSTPEPSTAPSATSDSEQSDIIGLSNIQISESAKATYEANLDGSSDSIPDPLPEGGIDTSSDGAYDKTVAVTDNSDNFTNVVWDVATKYGFNEGSSNMSRWERYDLNNGGQEIDLDEFPDGLFKVVSGTRSRHKITFESGYELERDTHCTIVGIVEIKDGTTTLHSLMVDGQPLLDDGLGKYMYS